MWARFARPIRSDFLVGVSLSINLLDDLSWNSRFMPVLERESATRARGWLLLHDLFKPRRVDTVP